MDPEFIPTTVAGHKMGLGRYQEQEIEYVGDPLDAFLDREFTMVRRPVYDNASYAHYNWIKHLVLPKPAIDSARCTRCGLCVEACPVPDKALKFANGGRQQPPVYRHGDCIRCYCCQEMCPNQAIYTTTPLLGKILHR
jgi:NAD-dependent dihydropyrimidine dehydrogenase PreA subunit